MAKRRSKKSRLSKELQIAIAIGLVITFFAFGGQLTGLATSHATDIDITISNNPSCTITTAPTAVSATGGVAATYEPTGDGTLANNGNVELLLQVQANQTVNDLFSAGTTVTFDAIAGTGTTTQTDITAITTSAQTWCDGVANGEDCDFDFNVITTASEVTGVYDFTYTITCSAT